MGEAQSLYNSDYVPEILVALRKGEQITEVQTERFGHWFRSFNRNMDNQLRQYQRGLLPESVPRSIRLGVTDNIASIAASRALWESTKNMYSDEYINFADEVIASYMGNGDSH